MAVFAQQGLGECWPGLPKFLGVSEQREEGNRQDGGQRGARKGHQMRFGSMSGSLQRGDPTTVNLESA